MRLTFWGTRGSITTPGPDKVRYGCNTPCVSITSQGETLILDAGIGIILLAEQLMAARRPKERLHLHLLLSHLHWDHVIGLPFFTPIFFKNIELDIWGRRADEVESATERLFTSVYSPIEGTKNLGATLHYRSLAAGTIQLGPFQVDNCLLRHPAGALAFRVKAGGKSLVYASDHESGDEAVDGPLIALAQGADLLIHDAQWMLDERKRYRNYGHSTWMDAVDHAREAGVHTLVLFHHHHRHADDTLDEIGRRARERAGSDFEVVVARDGLLFDL